MIRRLILLAIVIVALAPGTFVRSTLPPPDVESDITIARLTDLPENLGPFEVLNAWQLSSTNDWFGSYSALRATAPGRYLAVSDRGNALRFSIAGAQLSDGTLSRLPQDAVYADKYASDVEALATQPETGAVWLAYEGLNAIERRNADLTERKRVRPKAMANWLGNSGPEAMLRFPDGRFIVIGEGTRAWTDKRLPAVMFNGDPVEAEEAVEFAFRAPEDFRPTDMAALPDGRVLILLRRIVWGLPPYFEIGLLVANPARIEEGKVWNGKLLTTFKRPFPTDNYEGLSVESDGGFPVILTLISDDNGISYQRTLVAQLQWDGRSDLSPASSQ